MPCPPVEPTASSIKQ
jgi:hypothetical protein